MTTPDLDRSGSIVLARVGVCSAAGTRDDPERRCALIINARQAMLDDVETVSDILRDAASWLDARGDPLWVDAEFQPERIVGEVEEGLYWLAEDRSAALGTVRFQLEDPIFGVDPVSWTPESYDGRSLRCPSPESRTRRSSGSNWLT